MKNIYFFFVLIAISCGKGKVDVDIKNTGSNQYKTGNFFMSTNEDLIADIGVIKKVNLIDLIPELHSLEIEKESFWLIMERLERVSNHIESDYVVITKEGCAAKVGYCFGYFLNRDKR